MHALFITFRSAIAPAELQDVLIFRIDDGVFHRTAAAHLCHDGLRRDRPAHDGQIFIELTRGVDLTSLLTR